MLCSPGLDGLCLKNISNLRDSVEKKKNTYKHYLLPIVILAVYESELS